MGHGRRTKDREESWWGEINGKDRKKGLRLAEMENHRGKVVGRDERE